MSWNINDYSNAWMYSAGEHACDAGWRIIGVDERERERERERSNLHDRRGQTPLAFVQTLLEVLVEILEHQRQLLLRMHNIIQPILTWGGPIIDKGFTFKQWSWRSYLTMLQCRSSFSIAISRMAVLGMPSSSSSKRIFFKAMISPEVLSLALNTTPYVP